MKHRQIREVETRIWRARGIRDAMRRVRSEARIKETIRQKALALLACDSLRRRRSPAKIKLDRMLLHCLRRRSALGGSGWLMSSPRSRDFRFLFPLAERSKKRSHEKPSVEERAESHLSSETRQNIRRAASIFVGLWLASSQFLHLDEYNLAS